MVVCGCVLGAIAVDVHVGELAAGSTDVDYSAGAGVDVVAAVGECWERRRRGVSLGVLFFGGRRGVVGVPWEGEGKERMGGWRLWSWERGKEK